MKGDVKRREELKGEKRTRSDKIRLDEIGGEDKIRVNS